MCKTIGEGLSLAQLGSKENSRITWKILFCKIAKRKESRKRYTISSGKLCTHTPVSLSSRSKYASRHLPSTTLSLIISVNKSYFAGLPAAARFPAKLSKNSSSWYFVPRIWLRGRRDKGCIADPIESFCASQSARLAAILQNQRNYPLTGLGHLRGVLANRSIHPARLVSRLQFNHR